MRGVYVPRVNHFGVISRPLALTDITAIDCDLLPNDYKCSVLAIGSYWHCEVTWLTMLTNAESRPLAPTGPARKTCQSKVNFCKHSILTTTIKDYVNEQSDLVYFMIKKCQVNIHTP